MTDSKHILVLGATQGIGAKCVDRALTGGHRVRAFARSAGDMDPRPNLEPFPGDATKPEDLSAALDGVDAVIFALGIKESVAMLWQEVTLFSDATKALLPAMEDAGVARLIAVTGFGAGDSANAMSRIERMGHRAILGKPYADKDRQEELIRASNLDWTIARPVILTNSSSPRGYKVLEDPKDWRNGLISRGDVADYAITAIEKNMNIRQAVVLSR